jgi:putative FmdB family regulatory protein
MPIYEYECPSCTARFEEMVKMGAPAPACPTCGGVEVRKLVSAAAFMLKGSGWYKDHYGLKKDSSGSSGDGAAKADAPKPSGDSSSGSSGGSSGSSGPASGTPPATPSSSSSSGSSASAS